MLESADFLASSPRGLADLLARELAGFGAADVRERSNGVAFTGSLSVAYRALLESRLANRVFLHLASFEAPDAEAFYQSVRAIDWASHLGPESSLACEFSGRHPTLTNTHFGALKLKDAIVDSVRDAAGNRPNIAIERPDLRVHAHAHNTRITVSLDLSGESLHRRGYRTEGGEAPLKENVAAGMLLRAGWPELAAASRSFLDPMCGSGTLLIEAALIAADHAPGLGRDHYGFCGWRGHDARLWDSLRQEARQRSRLDSTPAALLRGSDRDPAAVRTARRNVERAGVARWVELETTALLEVVPSSPAGLMAVNPPYGVRLQDKAAALEIHRQLGQVLRERFQGWSAAILSGSPELGMELGLRAARTHKLWNGALECRLLRINVDASSARAPGSLGKPGKPARDSAGARMFGNRIAKNLRNLRSWVAREGVSCYRLYDADMPEYAFAVNLYRTLEPELTYLYVQEYAAPPEIEEDAVRRRRREALDTLPELLGIPVERMHVRTRRRGRHGAQYSKSDDRQTFHVVAENGLRFRVNLDDYLDTGLFLDHRITRARVRDLSCGKRFLNLFAYTGTATVYAAAGGAISTTSVDLSHTYLEWARRNLELNGCAAARHSLQQADCREWLSSAARSAERYDLIFLDPPTFSNSKRMAGVLDVERDHAELIDGCAGLLAPGGLLIFSTNSQRFRLDQSLAARYAVQDISERTLPPDFARNPRIHRCYEIRLPGPAATADP